MLKLFYFKKENNYGDVMSPWLLRKLDVPFSDYNQNRFHANAIMIGSIANKATRNMHVWGSGFIRRNDIVCKDANYHWVRGPISRQMIIDVGGNAPELYGDAALLLPDFIEESKKEHDVGYIPHHIHYKNLKVDGFKIDLTRSIEDVTKEITKCRSVISSSLHGIIVAHAYGIPAAYVELDGGLTGDGMKFDDHYQSVGLEGAIMSTPDDPIFQVPTNIDTSHIYDIMKGFKRKR